MTKHFCDICGKPALDTLPEIRIVPAPPSQGATNKIQARMEFTKRASPESLYPTQVDICGECAIWLMKQMIEQLSKV